MEGFNFNRSKSTQWVLDRNNLTATVTVPRIITDIDLLNIQKLPFFRLMVTIGTVSDLACNPGAGLHGASNTTTGEWFKTQSIVPEQTLTVQLNDALVQK